MTDQELMRTRPLVVVSRSTADSGDVTSRCTMKAIEKAVLDGTSVGVILPDDLYDRLAGGEKPVAVYCAYADLCRLGKNLPAEIIRPKEN